MVEQSADQLDIVFGALADPTRRTMLRNLTSHPHSVSELAAPFAITLAAASKHIKVLERAGLVRRSVRGRTHICQLDARPMQAGAEWMRQYERFWNERLDNLDAVLRAEDGGGEQPHASRNEG